MNVLLDVPGVEVVAGVIQLLLPPLHPLAAVQLVQRDRVLVVVAEEPNPHPPTLLVQGLYCSLVDYVVKRPSTRKQIKLKINEQLLNEQRKLK